MEKETDILTNQTTIQILLYFKKYSSSNFGLRETQRKLKISNPSIVSFHLKKLIEMNLITKNVNNRYHITQEGINYDSFKFSVSLEPKVIRGHFVPHLTNLLVFTASILATVLTLFLFHLAVEYLLTILYFSLLTIFGLLIREWLYFQKELKNYTNLENKNRLS